MAGNITSDDPVRDGYGQRIRCLSGRIAVVSGSDVGGVGGLVLARDDSIKNTMRDEPMKYKIVCMMLCMAMAVGVSAGADRFGDYVGVRRAQIYSVRHKGKF